MSATPQRVEPDLEPKFFFGLTAGLSGNCFFVNDEKIVYRAAGVLVVYDTSSNSQEFVRLNDAHKTITTMDFNSHRNLIVVAETGKKQPSVGVYSLSKRKHLRQLTVPTGPGVTGFVKIKFAHDDTHLAVLSGEPEFTMYFVNLKNGQIKSSVRVVHPPTVVGPVHDMALNPEKPSLCCFVGKGLFRSMMYSDSNWRQYGFHRVNKLEFTTVCWLNENRVLAGTTDGRLFLVENGELKAAYNAKTLLVFDPNVAIPNPLNVKRLQDVAEIRCCTPFKDGLMFVVGGHRIYYYKLDEDQKSFVRYAVFEVSEQPKTSDEEEALTMAATVDGGDSRGKSHDIDRRQNPINTICVSSKTAKMLCTTDTRLYLKSMAELSEMTDVTVPVEPLGEPLHVGGVAGLSVCTWKPWFMTCGRLDRTAKLWDHAHRALLLSARYPDDDVLDVALHPSGLHAVLAFRGRATFAAVHGPVGEMTLRPRAEIAGGGGHLVRFSEAGHRFAVVDDGPPRVRVYCSVTFRVLFDVGAAHEAKITDLNWAADDWELYTCDESGRVCQFDLYKGKYTNSVLFADYSFQGLAVTKDLKEIYTVSLDGRLRKIFLWTVTRDQNLKHGALNAVILSASNAMLFATCQHGGILSMSLPMESPGVEFKEFVMHNQIVTKMRLTGGDSTLITCSADGSVCLWDVKNADGPNPPMFPEDVIVSREDVNLKLDAIAALESRIHLSAVQSAADAAALTKAYGRLSQELDHMRSSKADQEERHLQEAIVLHNACKMSLENDIVAMNEKHEIDMKTAKEDYEKKLIYEDMKYARLEQYIRDIDEDMKKKKETMLMAHKERMEALADKFNTDMKEKEDNFEKFKGTLDEEKKSLGQEIDEFEDQCDREVLKLKIIFGPKIIKYSNQSKKVQKEISDYMEKIKAIQKIKEDLENLTEKYEKDVEELKILNSTLDTTIAGKEKEMEDFEEVLRNKDAVIHAKKLRAVELETEISDLKLKEEKQNQMIRSLVKTQMTLDPTTQGMKTLLNLMGKKLETMKMRCDQPKQKIKIIHSEIEQVEKAIRENIALVKKTKIDLIVEYKDAKNDVSRLRNYLVSLSHRFDLRTGKDNILKEMQLLERCRADLEVRYVTLLRRQPKQARGTKENGVLLATINKLQNEVAINRAQYEERMNLIEGSIRSNAKDKLESTELSV